MAKLHIKKDDTVYVLAGDDKGKTGRVLSIDAKKNRAIVEGVNMVSKSTKPNAQHPQGGIIKKEAPFTCLTSMSLTPRAVAPLALPAWASRLSATRMAKWLRKYVILKNQERRLSNGYYTEEKI